VRERAVAGALLTLALLGPTAPAAAEDDGPTGLAALGLKGTVILKNFSHFDTTRDDPQLIRDEGAVRLEFARRLTPWSDARLVGEVRKDDGDLTDGVNFQIQDKNRRRSLLDLKEAVLTLRRGPLDVSLGKQSYAWGTADTFNPTDNLNAYDYLDVVDNEKLGLWSAAFRLTAAATTATFVVVPAFVPSRLPLARSRWVPSPPAGFVGVADDPEVPGIGAGHVEYAARVRTTVRGVDLSASYYDGFEHVPVIRVGSLAVAPGVVLPRFTPVYTRVKVPGFDVSTTYGPFELHAETAARFVESHGRDDRWQGIAGFNYTWDTPPLPGVEQIVFLGEYAREITLHARPRSNILPLDGLPGLGDLFSSTVFREALIGRMLLKLSEDTQAKLTTLVDLDRTPNAFVQPRLTHRMTDALQAEGGLDLFAAGDRESVWGRFRRNNRVFLVLKYFF
jgi:hypothetical protein